MTTATTNQPNKTDNHKPTAQTAKVFMSGRSQAVRLPKAFRFDCDEVYIRRDAVTGNIILSKKPTTWDDFFALLDELEPNDIPENFLTDRPKDPPPERDLF